MTQLNNQMKLRAVVVASAMAFGLSSMSAQAAVLNWGYSTDLQFTGSTSFSASNSSPVSYTHLDVNKRQVIN